MTQHEVTDTAAPADGQPRMDDDRSDDTVAPPVATAFATDPTTELDGDHAATATDAEATDAATAADAEAVDEADEAELDPEVRAAEDPRSPGQLLVALEEAEAQRDEYLDALQRARAEFDNYRRRATRDAQNARQLGTGDLVAKLLDVLDDVDRTAAAAEQSEDTSLAGGVRAVQRKLADVLVASGVDRVDEVDVPFDANRHEAVQQVPADEPGTEPEVANVLRPGYLHGDRVLRAAMVVVRQ